MSKHTSGEWFLGTGEINPGEYAYDGIIWAAPTDEDVKAADESLGELIAEPYMVAECGYQPDAQLMMMAPKLLEALLPFAELLNEADIDKWQGLLASLWVHVADIKKAQEVVAKARGDLG